MLRYQVWLDKWETVHGIEQRITLRSAVLAQSDQEHIIRGLQRVSPLQTRSKLFRKAIHVRVEGQRKEANGYANRNLSTYELRSYVRS